MEEESILKVMTKMMSNTNPYENINLLEELLLLILKELLYAKGVTIVDSHSLNFKKLVKEKAKAENKDE